MPLFKNNFWEQNPFVKIVLAFAVGIILQWYIQPALQLIVTILVAALASLFLFFLLPFFKKYKYRFTTGIAVMLAFISLGALLSIKKDIRNAKDWLGHYYKSGDALVFTIDEPLIEKTKSYKTTGQANYVIAADTSKLIKGKVIFYFQKDSSLHLSYGDKIIFTKPLQEIKNTDNPGGFDYKRYSLFQGITHQVYLKPADYMVLNEKSKSPFKEFIYNGREKVLGILRKYIHGNRELGLAEALLIGYKNDLEQSLVQSYTNTGVVHIIAISGLHLGLIYWLLGLFFKPLKNKKNAKWLRPLLIIAGLWLFSFLAGAQPSILRSALMFTCIILGESFSRKTSIYNTIALSAFILLCINPFWLWDVGFQLSYAAVLSIIIFMRPIYNWFYIKNKALDFIWKMNAVTLAAQILTVPLGLYHFHQFPNLFMLTNFLAVPLSSLIVLGEILLCIVSFIPFIANFIGKLIWGMIWVMNTYIEKIESISFSLWDALQINIAQALLLLLFAIGLSYWLIEKSVPGLKAALFSLLAFISIRSFSLIESNAQQKIIVYNVPQKSAIDFIDGRSYKFLGDSDLLANGFARNFHLKPSRTLLRITDNNSLTGFMINNNYISYRNKKILLIDTATYYEQNTERPEIDLLIISKSPKLYLQTLTKAIHIKQVVFDGSVPVWKTKYWKADCDSLRIPWHDVSTNGAFVLKL